MFWVFWGFRGKSGFLLCTRKIKETTWPILFSLSQTTFLGQNTGTLEQNTVTTWFCTAFLVPDFVPATLCSRTSSPIHCLQDEALQHLLNSYIRKWAWRFALRQQRYVYWMPRLIARARTDNWSHFQGTKKGERAEALPPQKQSRLLLKYSVESWYCLI